ncbi:hypothetical protein [Histidinibacterium lentulum]|uniref:hypothetical protein n=1 Tax=Histidinibacterium lentulum TaxID=2480588 RepID=UPI000F4BF0B7|nr:hypothetical protein [Histidinibacterium lentulum]
MKLDDFSVQTRILAASITLTEMKFRPWSHRLVEYLYVLGLIALRRDVSTITVGVSQISIRHYKNYQGAGQFEALRQSMSAINNLRLCCAIIEDQSIKTPRDAARKYNGASSVFYRNSLSLNFSNLRELSKRRSA